MRVRIFHNNNPRDAWIDGYVAGRDTVTEVSAYDTQPRDPEPLSFAFELLNVGHDPDFGQPPDDRALVYRARRNRSLCVGDVIAITDTDHEGGGPRWRFYAVSGQGFTAITEPIIAARAAHGTTPIDAAPHTEYRTEGGLRGADTSRRIASAVAGINPQPAITGEEFAAHAHQIASADSDFGDWLVAVGDAFAALSHSYPLDVGDRHWRTKYGWLDLSPTTAAQVALHEAPVAVLVAGQLACPVCGAADHLIERENASRVNELHVVDGAIVGSFGDADWDLEPRICCGQCDSTLRLPRAVQRREP